MLLHPLIFQPRSVLHSGASDPVLQEQLESARPRVVRKHQTQVKVAEEEVSDGVRRGGGTFKRCFG